MCVEMKTTNWLLRPHKINKFRYQKYYVIIEQMWNANTINHFIIQIYSPFSFAVSNCIENLIRYNNENDVGVNEDSEDADILIESEELQQPSTPPRAIEPNQSQGMTAKYTGAIRKTSATSSNTYAWPASPSNKFQSDAGNSKSNSQSTGHFNYSQQQNQKPSFSSFMQNGSANQFADHSTGTPYNNRRRNDEIPDHPQYRAVVSDIRQGHRVLVIMRGAPGCGKSHLARRIVDETVNGDYESHIFSTDDFFYDKKKDRYVYNRDFLEPAHNANQSKVTQRALNGWSPIIVDNTNIRLWEMVPYLREGVNNGYLIHILEPNTPWARSSGKLAMRNKHGVPRNKIEQMLANYEMATVEQCLAIYKLVYSIPVPIQRNYPSMVNYTTNTTIVPNNNNANPRNASNATHEPRSQRKRRPQQPTTQTMPLILANVVENNESDTFQWAAEHLQSLNNRWAAFDPEQNAQSWNTTSAPMPVRSINTAPLPQRSEPKIQSNGIYDLLRNLTDVLNVESTPIKTDDQTTEEKIQLEKHEKECPNENDSFRQIRQIYPDRAISYLWDLFEKCNGDGNWTMDILLKDEDTTNTNQLLTEESRRQDNFTCSCRTGPVHNTFQDAVNAIPTALLAESAQLPPSVTLNTKSTRRDRVETQIESEIRRQIEEQFAINDEQDSVHVRKLRDFRRGIQSGEATSSTPKPIEASVEEMVADGDDGMSDGDELIDVDLGVELVCQLDRVFGSDAFQRDHLKDMKTTVFMPRALGQQLYAIWMESLYNQIEEQRQKSIKEDEEFAKQLHLKEKYPKIMQENQPNNLKDIMEMEYAWKAYQTDVDDWKKTTPQDLASKMTRAKLFEIFPNVNRDTLVEVLAAHGNKFDNTVEVLKESLGSDINDKMAVESQRLLKEVRNETQAVSYPAHLIYRYISKDTYFLFADRTFRRWGWLIEKSHSRFGSQETWPRRSKTRSTSRFWRKSKYGHAPSSIEGRVLC